MHFTLPTNPNLMRHVPIDLIPGDTSDAEPLSPLKAARTILDLVTDIKGTIVSSQKRNADREFLQEQIAEQTASIIEWALIAGYYIPPGLLLLDVQTQDSANSALEDIEDVIQTAIELVHSLGGFEQPEPMPAPTPLEAAQAILPGLLDIEEQMVFSLSGYVDLEKIHTNIEAAVHHISKLAPFAEYDGVGFLSSINIRDAVGTEAGLEQLDTEVISLLGLIDDLNQVDEDQTVRGTKADDAIATGDGDDIVTAGRGDDLVDAGDGENVLFGGWGEDRLRGGTGSDAMDGGYGNDVLRGNGGHDQIFGGEGHDRLRGDAGGDVLHGGNGDDFLTGGGGNDTLIGGGGADALLGGAGADVFVFEEYFGHDTVRDFNADAGDHLAFILNGDAFDDWTAQTVLDASSQSGRDVVIRIQGNDNMVTLVDTDLAALTISDIDVFSYT